MKQRCQPKAVMGSGTRHIHAFLQGLHGSKNVAVQAFLHTLGPSKPPHMDI